MACQIHTHLNPKLAHKTIHTSASKQPSTCFSFQPNPRVPKTALSVSSYNNPNEQQLVSTKPITEIPESDAVSYNVKFKTLGACKLGISRYPDFQYNADGGRGSGTAKNTSDGEVYVDFDVKEVYIPPLDTSTTKFLGLPLPPFLKIDIFPEAFQGVINLESGKVGLKFRAKFCFSFGTIYRAPPLLVDTVLTSEESKGKIRGGRGERLDKDGKCRLVGVATVDPIDDFFMDTFLSLPTECLADLNAIITFSNAV